MPATVSYGKGYQNIISPSSLKILDFKSIINELYGLRLQTHFLKFLKLPQNAFDDKSTLLQVIVQSNMILI